MVVCSSLGVEKHERAIVFIGMHPFNESSSSFGYFGLVDVWRNVESSTLKTNKKLEHSHFNFKRNAYFGVCAASSIEFLATDVEDSEKLGPVRFD